VQFLPYEVDWSPLMVAYIGGSAAVIIGCLLISPEWQWVVAMLACGVLTFYLGAEERWILTDLAFFAIYSCLAPYTISAVLAFVPLCWMIPLQYVEPLAILVGTGWLRDSFGASGLQHPAPAVATYLAYLFYHEDSALGDWVPW
jgi:hypothetical protein